MEAVEVSTQNNNKCPVSVRSSQALSSISDPVLAGITNVIGKNINWTEEEKQRCLDRFKEIYVTSLKDNVGIDPGRSSNNCKNSSDNEKQDTSDTEMEPVDEGKRKHFKELLPQVDDELCFVARKRKVMPLKNAQHLAKQCKFECHYARRSRASAVESSQEYKAACSSADSVSTEDIQPVMRRVAGTVADSIKLQSLPSILQNADHLEKAAHMLAVDFQTTTDQVLFHPQPEEDQVARSLSPLRKRPHTTSCPVTPQQVGLARQNSLRRKPPRLDDRQL